MGNDKWSSKAMFILAAIGSAVGIGNLWRFTYMAGEYGGGTFIAIYLVCVLLLGIPIMILEFTAGRRFAAPLTQAFCAIKKQFLPAALAFHGLNILVLSYYVVVTGWTLAYFFGSITGVPPPLNELSQNPLFMVFTPISVLIIFTITRLKLVDGIEKANRMLMPLFFIILVIMFGYSLSLPGLQKALEFYTHFGEPTPQVVAAAVAQTLFSLSIGVGIMLTYASHMYKRDDIGSSAAIVAGADTIIALVAGIAIFPIVFTYGLDPAGGAGLAFNSLPLAFAQMPFGNILMPLFFILLFSVAITSAISMAEVVVSNLAIKYGRKSAARITALIIGVVAIPSMLSYSSVNLSFDGMPVLDFLDGKVVVLLYPIAALLLVLILGWGWTGFPREAAKVVPRKLLSLYIFIIRFLVPFALGAIVISSLV
ncbi:sodium-dependent transporter [Candidatus Micrarchaeota archaeon]|nr:sodium-dependent transporter [Candidatus Micrarchaeota archaeon]